MNANTLVEAAPAVRGVLRLFTLYEDFDTCTRARRLIDGIARRTASEWKISSGMWRLAWGKPIGRIHQMMAQQAAESDILVVACSHVDKAHDALIRWLYALPGWRANPMPPGLLIALLGDESLPAGAPDGLVSQMTAFAARNGMDFVWHRPSGGVGSSWIEPSLQKFLAAKIAADACSVMNLPLSPHCHNSAVALPPARVTSGIMRKKILVVEDDAELVEMLSFKLRSAGFAVGSAGDGIEAIKKARSISPDLILLDVMLPKLDGFAVCETLRRDPATAGVPILLLTALSSQFAWLTGLASGANDYLTKPFSPNDLIRRIKDLLYPEAQRDPNLQPA